MFPDLKRSHLYFLFYNWIGEFQLGLENFQVCIKRAGIEVTACGLPDALAVTDHVLQVGFLRKGAVDDWVVGCVYTMCSGANNALVRKRSVNRDVSAKQSIAIVNAILDPVPAYMCFIFEP